MECLHAGDDKPVYLSTYDVYDVLYDKPAEAENNNAFVVMEVARARNVAVKGVTTERRRRGELVCLPSEAEGAYHRVYVGRFNTFSDLRSHPVLSLRSSDKSYFEEF